MIRRLALLAALASAASSADLYRVAGTVVDAATGSPMPGVQVVLFPPAAGAPLGSMVTRDDGKFSFDAPAGKLRLMAGKGEVRQSFGLRKPDVVIPVAVITGPGLDTANLVFRWFPPVSITGRVVDSSGEPVEQALVQLVSSRVVAGQRVTNTTSWSRTDDRGEYRFWQFPAGTYFLTVSGKPWYADRPGAEAISASYVTAYYGGADASRPTPLVLKPGEEAVANFSLATVPGAQVAVKYDAPEGIKGTIALTMQGIGASEGYQRQESTRRSPHQFGGVPPGAYDVVIRGTVGGVTYSGRRSVQVSGPEASVEVALAKLPSITGQVELGEGVTRRAPLYLSLIPADGGRAAAALVRPDGSFQLPTVAAARYRVRLGSTDGLFASSIRVEGSDYRGGVLDLHEGQTVTLRIAAANHVGHPGGVVLRDGRPIEGVMVVLMPAAPTTDPLQFRGYVTDTDGTFEYRNTPAGDYLLFAVDDPDLEYANPAALEPYRAKATPVKVEAKATSTHKLTVIDPAPK
jgi:hypothetical protein